MSSTSPRGSAATSSREMARQAGSKAAIRSGVKYRSLISRKGVCSGGSMPLGTDRCGGDDVAKGLMVVEDPHGVLVPEDRPVPVRAVRHRAASAHVVVGGDLVLLDRLGPGVPIDLLLVHDCPDSDRGRNAVDMFELRRLATITRPLCSDHSRNSLTY